MLTLLLFREKSSIIRKLAKTNFGIPLPVFSLNTTHKSNPMRHFAANLPRAWESSNYLTSSPQKALHADQNGDRAKFKLVLKASFERRKRNIYYKRTFFCAKTLLFGRYFLREWRFPLSTRTGDKCENKLVWYGPI